jgi:hypothetical protein
MSTLTANTSALISWALTETTGAAGQADTGAREWSHIFEDGSGDYQANLKYTARRTLAASATETIDFTALTQGYLDATGASFSFAAIKLFLLVNRGTAASNIITIDTNGLADPLDEIVTAGSIRLHYDGTWLVSNKRVGWAVTSSAKNLRFTNIDGSNAVTYDILAIGV